MKLIGLYSGSYILKHKDERGFKLGRSRQTAKSAYNGIMKKYGEVKPGSKYHHVGKGAWRIYSISKDRQRTGKTTTDKKKWAKRPHKLDYMGVDTSGACPMKKPSIKTEHNKYFIPKSNDMPLLKQFRNDYSESSRVGYVPFSSGLIIYHDVRPRGAIVLQDRKSGLYFIMFIYPDGSKTAKISKNYSLRTKYSKKEVIKELGEWEKRTGNIT